MIENMSEKELRKWAKKAQADLKDANAVIGLTSYALQYYKEAMPDVSMASYFAVKNYCKKHKIINGIDQ